MINTSECFNLGFFEEKPIRTTVFYVSNYLVSCLIACYTLYLGAVVYPVIGALPCLLLFFIGPFILSLIGLFIIAKQISDRQEILAYLDGELKTEDINIKDWDLKKIEHVYRLAKKHARKSSQLFVEACIKYIESSADIEFLEKIVGSRVIDFLTACARNPHITKLILYQLIQKDRQEIDFALAENVSISTTILSFLVIRQHILGRYDLNNLLDVIGNHPQIEKLRQIAKNTSDPDVLNMLAETPFPCIKRLVWRKNQATSKEVFDKLLKEITPTIEDLEDSRFSTEMVVQYLLSKVQPETKCCETEHHCHDYSYVEYETITAYDEVQIKKVKQMLSRRNDKDIILCKLSSLDSALFKALTEGQLVISYETERY